MSSRNGDQIPQFSRLAIGFPCRKSELNGEVTLLQGVICTVEYNLGLSQGDCNWEVFLLVR